MKKSVRLHLTGSVQPVFFNGFIKEHADKLNIKGYLRHLEDKRVEIFIEGHIDNVREMTQICQRGPKHTVIRSCTETPETHQGFKDFKVITF